MLFGSNNERIYAAELGLRSVYIAASFPGAIIRRATGTPFMGYAGATYLVQEYCNALFDALFNMLPLGQDLDRIDATPARDDSVLHWDADAAAVLEQHLETEPFLVRISAAKRLREQVEADARRHGERRVTEARIRTSFGLAPTPPEVVAPRDGVRTTELAASPS